MTLEEFNRDWVPILNLCLGTMGAASLVMLWWQLRQTAIWNRLQSQYSFRDSPTFAHQRRVVEAAAAIGVDIRTRATPLTDDEVTRLWSNNEAYWAVYDYLNDLEAVCTAVRVGCVDPQIAYAEYSSPVIRASTLYSGWITRVRGEYDDEELYGEVQRVANMWRMHDEKVRRAREAVKAKIERKREIEAGVKKRV